MRIFLVFLASVSFFSPKAQTVLPAGSSNDAGHKWYVSKYAGLSANSFFFAGGNTNFISAPVGLQLSYRLNKNLYPFAAVSAAPAFFSFKHLPAAPGFNTPYHFALNPRIEGGLMYVNDAKTFSISGSIGVERSSYPVYAPYRRQVTATPAKAY